MSLNRSRNVSSATIGTDRARTLVPLIVPMSSVSSKKSWCTHTGKPLLCVTMVQSLSRLTTLSCRTSLVNAINTLRTPGLLYRATLRVAGGLDADRLGALNSVPMADSEVVDAGVLDSLCSCRTTAFDVDVGWTCDGAGLGCDAADWLRDTTGLSLGDLAMVLGVSDSFDNRDPLDASLALFLTSSGNLATISRSVTGTSLARSRAGFSLTAICCLGSELDSNLVFVFDDTLCVGFF